MMASLDKNVINYANPISRTIESCIYELQKNLIL
jgi:hypothetical protein